MWHFFKKKSRNFHDGGDLKADFLSWQVQNFQLICYSQRVNATSQYNDSGSARCSKWPNDRMVAMMKYCWLPVQGGRGCRERWLTTTTSSIGVQENIGMFSKS